MDDQLLEKRLDSLKKAYDEMPEEENRSAILAAIKKDQKKHTKQKWFHLPYAASFIGVGMIAGVLMMQYIGEQEPSEEKTEQHQAATGENSSGELKKSDVKIVFDELRQYHAKKVARTKAALGFGAGFEKYLYPSIAEDIESVENEYLTYLEDHDSKDLTDTKQALINQIDESFILPSEIIDRIEKQDKAMSVKEEFPLLAQLDSFNGAYLYAMVFYEWDIKEAIEKEGLEVVVEKMNAGGKGLENQDLRKMAAGAVANGYVFREEDGKLMPYVNFKDIADRLRGKVDDDYAMYLELKSNRIHDRMGKVISYKNYADVLVKLEKAIGTMEDGKIKDILRDEAQSLYVQFAAGSPGNSIYGDNKFLKDEVKEAYLYLMDSYPETDTATAMKEVYDKMEAKQFQQPTDELEIKLNLIYPLYMKIPSNLKAEDIINSKILPIPDSLLSSYKEFAAKKNFNILKHYGPFEIMQLYFHADQVGDYETKYALYSRQSTLPPKEQYIKEREEAEPGMNLSKILKGYQFASLYHPADDPEKVIGIQLHYSDRTDGPVFQMVQEDGFWKVQYMPIQ